MVHLLAPLLHIWVLTDGKAGDEMPCVGIAETLSQNITVLRVDPRFLWSVLAPQFFADPRDISMVRHALKACIPDIVIASGRRSIPILRWLKGQYPQIFTVFLKDPRTRFSRADLIWTPAHDHLKGANVISTLTTPHRISAQKLRDARREIDPRFPQIATLKVAVLLGGDSRHHQFTLDDQERFITLLKQLTQQDAALFVTPSRRTPKALADIVKDLCNQTNGFYWDGAGENPYIKMLAHADYVVVTADSTNMVGEAAATGKPILVFEPSGGHRKITHFLKAMFDAGLAHPFTGALVGEPYAPLDATPAIAQAIIAKYMKRVQNHEELN